MTETKTERLSIVTLRSVVNFYAFGHGTLIESRIRSVAGKLNLFSEDRRGVAEIRDRGNASRGFDIRSGSNKKGCR